MFDRIRNGTITLLGIVLCLYTLLEVNFPRLQVQSGLAIFVMLGLVLCFLGYPIHKRLKDNQPARYFDVVLAIAAVVCCLFVVIQSEEAFKFLWLNGMTVGDRAGAETTLDFVVGVIGMLLVLEATRRSIGWIVPALALSFVLHSYYCYLSTKHNEVQSLAVAGDPNGGNFTIGFGNQTTKPLAIDTSGSEIRRALQGLETIGRGNASASGPKGGPWQVIFRNKLEYQDVALLTVDASKLEGGKNPRVLVVETERGSKGDAPRMPGWLLPHGGQSAKDIASTAFLQSLGVFGIAAGVMFKYVFLFVIFGAFLEISGATQFIIDFAERVFGRSPGGPAKVSVLGSGLMGSLSGSAVANAVTTGAFTIPMMRSAGFERHTAGGITAAAASGGALVPPVMGAGAYMMLELVKPQVTFLEIARAAVIPAILYYFSLWMIVHFYSNRLGTLSTSDVTEKKVNAFDGVVFFAALGTLVGLLFLKFTAFKAVSGSLVVILLFTAFRRELKAGVILPRMARVWALVSFAVCMAGYVIYLAVATNDFANIKTVRHIFEMLLDASFAGMLGMIIFGTLHVAWRSSIVVALSKSSKNGISLVAASACVGIIIGIVQQTGIAANFSSEIKGVVEENLFVALLGIMFCSIILGMGVPSVVCYLLMATLMASLLSELGVIPLAAHLFIFYFGMMSMVTPPVALAAYASASIAEAKIMQTALAAFRFALVGFTLPFMFVYRPELLLLSDKPEFKVNDAKVAAQATISAELERFGSAVDDARVEFWKEGDDAPATSERTNPQGQIETILGPGHWNVVSYTKRRTLFNPKGEMPELDKNTWLETESGDRIDWQPGQQLDRPEKMFVVSDHKRLHLGVLVFDPDLPPAVDQDGNIDHRIRFDDERLSIVQVILAVGAAIVGILALAAGIVGFFRARLSIVMRMLMMIAAGLLLLPEINVGGRDVAVFVNLAGCVLFGVVAAFNRSKGPALTAAKSAADGV